MNLKPEEIVQALRCCVFGGPCQNCPEEINDHCMDDLHMFASELIERDQKEIAELKAKVEQYRALIPSWVIPMTQKEDLGWNG